MPSPVHLIQCLQHAAPDRFARGSLEHRDLRMDSERYACTWKNKLVSLTLTEVIHAPPRQTRCGGAGRRLELTEQHVSTDQETGNDRGRNRIGSEFADAAVDAR